MLDLLIEEKTYIAMDEMEAYSFIDEQRKEHNVEDSSVKYKKATAKKSEHWIVKIKFRIADADDYVLTGE